MFGWNTDDPRIDDNPSMAADSLKRLSTDDYAGSKENEGTRTSFKSVGVKFCLISNL